MDEGICYLGVYIMGNQNTWPMESHLWEKAMQYTSAFQKTPMTHCEASILYCSCFVPALTYPSWQPGYQIIF